MRCRPLLLAVSGLLLALPAVGEAQGVTVAGSVVRGALPLHEAAVYLVPLDKDVAALDPLDGAVINQVHLRFMPRVMVVTPGTEVRFLNSDLFPHNVFGPGGSKHAFDLGTYAEGAFQTHVFLEEGVHVILCHIHPEMAAYVLVANAPFRTTTSADGRFIMDGVQPGRYRLHAWHPRGAGLAAELDLTVGEGGVEDLRIVIRR